MSYKNLHTANSRALVDRFDQLPQNNNLTLATYVWIDCTGELIHNKTRTLEYRPHTPEELPWWDAEALITSVNTDIHLQPVRLYNDPFYFSEILVPIRLF